tara:strand:+ start:386 stop:553 length:168 start_codon:yes stop_codon:yes gene_type:complete
MSKVDEKIKCRKKSNDFEKHSHNQLGFNRKERREMKRSFCEETDAIVEEPRGRYV